MVKLLTVYSLIDFGSVNVALVICDLGLPVVFSHSIICRKRFSSPSSLPLTVPFSVFIHHPADITWEVAIKMFMKITFLLTHLGDPKLWPVVRCACESRPPELSHTLQNRTKPFETFFPRKLKQFRVNFLSISLTSLSRVKANEKIFTFYFNWRRVSVPWKRRKKLRRQTNKNETLLHNRWLLWWFQWAHMIDFALYGDQISAAVAVNFQVHSTVSSKGCVWRYARSKSL